MNDADLLRRYVEEDSQEAFTELVRLRLGLVYSAALRQTGGDAYRAQEVAQAVFTDLARKAASLCRHSALIGWLYTSTRYTVAKMARSDRRRRAWEQEAYSMNEDLAPPTAVIAGEHLRPLLDDALHRLSETDRRALLLRFFGDCSMAELGRSLGLSETTAQKKVERALGKLKTLLAQRGLSSTAVAIGVALGSEAAGATAPPGLAASISSGALAMAPAAGTGGLGLVSFMTASKLTVILGAAAIFGLLSIGTGIYELRQSQSAAAALELAGQRYQSSQAELRTLLRSAQQGDTTLDDLRKNAAAVGAAEDQARAVEKRQQADWRRFAEAFPALRNFVYETLKTSFDRSYRPLLERHGFAAAQIDDFVSRVTNLRFQNIGMDRDLGGVSNFGPDYGAEQLQAILGDQAFQQWKNFRNPEASNKMVLDDITASTTDAGEPLSPEQVVSGGANAAR